MEIADKCLCGNTYHQRDTLHCRQLTGIMCQLRWHLSCQRMTWESPVTPVARANRNMANITHCVESFPFYQFSYYVPPMTILAIKLQPQPCTVQNLNVLDGDLCIRSSLLCHIRRPRLVFYLSVRALSFFLMCFFLSDTAKPEETLTLSGKSRMSETLGFGVDTFLSAPPL